MPRLRLNTYGRQAFSVAGPMAWNSLSDFIRDPTSSTDCFRRLLKTYLFACYYSASSALGVLGDYALYKSTHSLTHSLTHLSSVSEQKPLSTLSLPVKHFVPLSLSVSELFSVICHDLPSGSISAAGPCPRAAANPPVTAAATIDGTDGLLVPPTRLAYVSALLFVNRYAFVCRYLHLTEFSFLPQCFKSQLWGFLLLF